MKKVISIVAASILGIACIGAGVTWGLHSNLDPNEGPAAEYYVCTTISAPNNETMLVEGQTLQLSATVTVNGSPEGVDQTVVWESSDPTIASISQTGLVEALSSGWMGIVTFTATSIIKIPGAPADIGKGEYTLNIYYESPVNGLQLTNMGDYYIVSGFSNMFFPPSMLRLLTPISGRMMGCYMITVTLVRHC